MAASKQVGKVISWEKPPGEAGIGWIRVRISKFEKREYLFTASTKQTDYTPLAGDRISFEVKKNRQGLEYASNVKFLMTGVT